MNDQEAFDKVATHLLTQRAIARNQFSCLLHDTVSGLKCAVGCLIPDDRYEGSMEMMSLTELVDSQLFGDLFDGISYQLLHDLRHVHDKGHPSRWKHNLWCVAAAKGLNDDVLKGFKDE